VSRQESTKYAASVPGDEIVVVLVPARYTDTAGEGPRVVDVMPTVGGVLATAAIAVAVTASDTRATIIERELALVRRLSCRRADEISGARARQSQARVERWKSAKALREERCWNLIGISLSFR
jgi:hypothetical protein